MATVLWAVVLGIRPWQAHLRDHGTWPRTDGTHADVEVMRVQQRVDHFSGDDPRVWSQRVFLRQAFFGGPGHPVFLCVGGEGPPLDANVLVRSVHCNDAVELAPIVGALLVAVEHRFYGPTATDRPLPSFGTDALRFLSSSQAIMDLAEVHAAITLRFNLTSSSGWVAFGGSYPGLVAGYSRIKLPHLIHAAISSSAPWRSVVDMPQYNDVVARALANPSVGGSEVRWG